MFQKYNFCMWLLLTEVTNYCEYNNMSKGTRSLKNVGGRTLYVKTNKATSCDKMAPIDCDEPEVAM